MKPSDFLFAAIAFTLSCGFSIGCAGAPPKYHFRPETKYSVSDPQFQRTMSSLLGPPMLEGNRITTLINGTQIFPPMLEAIRSAKKTINFETFIYWSGNIGSEFANALSEKAREGVRVNVIIDAVGGFKMDQDLIDKMKQAGVHFVKYHPLRWFDIGSAAKLNNRTHRKLLIVDGRVGFIGGVGIADKWLGNADSPDHWRDNHYRIEGQVVAQLQAAFLDNWIEVTGQVLDGEEYFPPLQPVGSQMAQLFKSSPKGGGESMHLMVLLSIAASRTRVLLSTAYFVPDDLTIETMVRARERGVAIQVILPGPIQDREIVGSASRAKWGELLKAGVEIYEYQPTMYHVKMMIVDNRWVSIGSANFDNRSFRLNDEANLNVFDENFAEEQARIFEQDRLRSHRVTKEEWEGRPLYEKVIENAAALFAPQF